jgi:hypothetical protein
MTRTTNLEDLVLVITFPTLPRVWNVSWNGALGNPSAASAVSAMTYAIDAGSAYGVRWRTREPSAPGMKARPPFACGIGPGAVQVQG